MLYARVSGSTGKETSLKSQVSDLTKAAADDKTEVVTMFQEKASGLNENRPKLKRALALIQSGEANRLYVTHKDRLSRFGTVYLEELIQSYGGDMVVLHDNHDETPEQELMHDFTALISCFSGRMYGRRSAEARKRLISEAGHG